MRKKTSIVYLAKKALKNLPFLFGAIVIILSVCCALFAYVVAPDNTVNANMQIPSLQMHPPGVSMSFLKIGDQSEHTNLFKSWTGEDADYYLLPMTSTPIPMNDTIILVSEYKGLNVPPIEQELSVTTLYAYSKEKNITDVLDESTIQRTCWLGTDQLGRDILSRLMVGSRVSLLVGFVSILISTGIGVLVGSLAGYYRGWIDQVIMWKISIFWSIPTLLLALTLYISFKDVFQSSFFIIFIAIGLTIWVGMARIVRGQFLQYKSVPFVEAANAMAFSDKRIIFRHILPNLIAPIIVIASANFANAILIEAGLSFLGLGIQPPTPSWGGMLNEFKDFIGTELGYIALFPGGLIMILVLSFNLVGNAIRDITDVKSSK